MALTRPKYSQIYDTDWKQSVDLASTGDVGNLVLGNTQPNSIDGISVAVGNRILVKDQTTPAQNGIYTVRNIGTGSDGWWERSLDSNQNNFVTTGLTATISSGSTNAGREYRLTTPDPITLGTTALSFIQVGAQPTGANTYVQFNDMNIMGGSPGFTFNKTANAVVIVGNLTAGNLSVGSISASTLDVAGGGLNAVAIGQTTPAAGSFTSLTASGKLWANSTLTSTSTSTGAVVVAGGVGVSGNVYASERVQAAAFYGNLGGGSVLPNIYVTGSIIPTANVAYDLGTPTQKFRSAYFSGNTVYIGSESMSVAADGTWSFTSKGAEVSLGIDAVFNPPVADISGNVTVGDVLTVGGRIYVSANTLSINGDVGSNGYVLRSTGTGIEWSAPSAGTAIDSGTSNVSILGSGADVVTTVGGSVITRTSAGGFTVNGNLFVNGNVTTINANNLSINDSLIYLADDNPTDVIDIGIVSSFTPGGGSYQHTGFVRDASDGVWKLFANVGPEPTTTVNFSSATYSTIRMGNIYAGGTTANDNRFLQATASGLAWTAVDGIINGTTKANASATSFDIIANGVNSAKFYNDIVYVYPSLDVGSDLAVAGVADITGNVTAAYFIGDGSQLTGLPAGYSNVNAATYLTVYSGVIKVASSTTAIINGGTNGVGNIGETATRFNTVFAKASSAQYADLAEVYASDKNYVPGTVLVFGGNKEVTISATSHDPSVAGVVSTNPAYLMNDNAEGAAVALQGRVPCRVKGPVAKGDRVVSSNIQGVAQRLVMMHYQPGCIIGKALESIEDESIKTIEVVVGRN